MCCEVLKKSEEEYEGFLVSAELIPFLQLPSFKESRLICQILKECLSFNGKNRPCISKIVNMMINSEKNLDFRNFCQICSQNLDEFDLTKFCKNCEEFIEKNYCENTINLEKF